MNAALLKMLGFDRAEDAVGRKLHDVIHHTHPDGTSYPKEQCPIYQAARTGRPAHVEDELFFRLDGTSFPVEYWTQPIVSDGEVRGAVTTFVDITARKRAVEALRASEARYRSLFESIDEGFCVVEMFYDDGGRAVDYRFVETNPAFDRHTGFHHPVGRTIREFVPHHDAHWFEVYGAVAATGEPKRFVEEAKAMGRWYDVYAFRVGGPDCRRVAILVHRHHRA